jgi:glycosyltransferase involved in cell wall biosynthesis
MNKNPRISVLLPIKSITPFLKQSLESICNQTFQDFELVIACDHHIKDEIIEITKNFNFEVKIFSLKLGGIAFALNTCINESVGEFLARWDSDDFSDINRFEEQIKAFDEDKDLDVVGTKCIIIDENNKPLTQVFKFFEDNNSIRKALKYRQPLLHPSIMMKREVVFDVNGYLYGHTSEDHEMFIRIARDKNIKFQNLSTTYTYYRRHPDQLSDFSHLKNHFREVGAFMLIELFRTKSPIYIIGFFANLPLFRKMRHFKRKFKKSLTIKS